jgi:hypothetical protein
MVRQLVTGDFRARVARAPKDTALVIGDPPLEGSTVFSQLPGAATEAKTVATLLRDKGFETTALIGPEANWPDVLSALYGKPYRVLHIAAHGVFEYEREPGAPKATGVVLESGEEIEAGVVMSSLDSRWTFIEFLDDGVLDPAFRDEVLRYKYRGSSGKVNLALDGLPELACKPGVGEWLRGAISFSPSIDYIEHAYDDAKYGRPSKRPYIDCIMPTLVDPTMAPPGKHVMSCFVQYAPYHLADGNVWDDRAREDFGQNVHGRAPGRGRIRRGEWPYGSFQRAEAAVRRVRDAHLRKLRGSNRLRLSVRAGGGRLPRRVPHRIRAHR